MGRSIGIVCLSLLGWLPGYAQTADSVVFPCERVRIIFHPITGLVDYRFASGISIKNTVAYVTDLRLGYLSTTGYRKHTWSLEHFRDSLGSGIRIRLMHTDERYGPVLEQVITQYAHTSALLLLLKVHSPSAVETRDICPLAILPKNKGILSITGSQPRILDVPFDNDDWVNDVERTWPSASEPVVSGMSYEFASVYDNALFSGLVLGSLTHDFWKTGIAYSASSVPGMIDSLTIFGGVATPDNPALPADFGGKDGTHDVAAHGTMRGAVVVSPLVYLCADKDVREAFMDFGKMNTRLNGRRSWKGAAPVYWNSFGVEDVMGGRKIMMPPDVDRISDFLDSLDQFKRYAKPVLSIDSYDQGIYSTAVLDSISLHGIKRNQQMGFYFTPFSEWTWKSSIDNGLLQGTRTPLRDVVLRDQNGQPIQYKAGDFGAYALDPTHPAVREAIIGQLEKAKAIHARFLKIDFLTAGALESTSRYDTTVRSGMQAYNRGMKMLRYLVDSILGPDIFITQAISPLFPNQYAHTRFISTDVYSHLRNDEPGFPDWGSTEASLAIGSHMWWEQGTLWPFTNLDVIVMQRFQRNPALKDSDVRVRLYAMMVMGSILGDGSDFRQPVARERARIFLNNPRVCAWFSHPEAFTPLKWADGKGMDQQLVFYKRGVVGRAAPGLTRTETARGLLAQFNFSHAGPFVDTFYLKNLGLPPCKYELRDFLTDQVIGTIAQGQTSFSLNAPPGDAILVQIVPVTRSSSR